MARFVKQALEIIDKLAKEAGDNGFAPLNPNDIRLDWQKALEKLTSGKLNAEIAEQTKTAEAALNALLNPEQRDLRKNYQESMKRWLDMRRALHAGEETRDEQEAFQEMRKAGASYHRSIKGQREVQSMENQIHSLFYIGAFVHTPKAEDRIREFAREAKNKKHLTIALPEVADDYNPAGAIIEEALRQQGLSYEANARQKGYFLQKDSFDPYALHMMATENADPIDFDELRKKVRQLGEKLSKEKWKRQRGADIAYEHTAPYPGEDEEKFLTRAVVQSLVEQYPDNIHLAMRRSENGPYMHNPMHDDQQESEAFPDTARLATKVSGMDAIKTILVDGLGIRRLDIGQGRGR